MYTRINIQLIQKYLFFVLFRIFHYQTDHPTQTLQQLHTRIIETCNGILSGQKWSATVTMMHGKKDINKRK